MTILADRVKETTLTIGTGTVALAGASPGFRTFSSSFSVGTQTYYCISDGINWEVGYGTLASATTFSRDTVLSSSNAGAKVPFGSGAKEIFNTVPSEYLEPKLLPALSNNTRTFLNGTNTWSEPVSRITVVDTNYTITTTSDCIIAITALSASRAIILPSANIPKQRILILDESGSCSSSNLIQVDTAGTDTIRGELLYNMISPYSVLELVSSGSGHWYPIAYDKYLSAGCVITPTVTDNNNGTITIGNGGVYTLFRNTAGIGNISAFTINGNTFTCVDGVSNYIVANYNYGSPVLQCIQDVSIINETSIIPIVSVYRGGTILHVLDWDNLGVALTNKIHRSIVKTQRYRRESGLSLAETGTRNVTIDAGTVWVGAGEHALPALNSTTNNIYFCYHNGGGVWATSAVHQYNNSQYDDGTTLQTLNPNKYAVNYIYRGVETRTECYMTLGTASYGTLADAVASQPGPVPALISSHAILVGRIIVLQGATTASQIDSAFNISFSGTTSTSHNDLSGLQGGQAGQYYHLTSSQYSNLTITSSATQTGLLTSSDWITFNNKANKTGFPDRTSSLLTFDRTTRIVTLSPTSGPTFSFSVNGVLYNKSTQTTTIPNVTGGYFVYFDNTGTLQTSTTPWNLLTTAAVTYVYWDSTLGDGFAFEERHGDTMDPETHYYLHNVNGTEALSGFTMSGYDLAGAGGPATNAFNTYTISSGVVADENIDYTTSTLSDGGPYTIFTRTGADGTWNWTKTNTLPFLVGTTYPKYNQYTGSTWQMTETIATNFINYYVFATTSLDPLFQYIIIPSQAAYLSLATAQAETYSSLSYGTLPFQEIVPLYQITLRNGTGTNYIGATGSCRIESVSRIVGSRASIASSAVSNHESLSGLLGGAAGDHYHLTGAQATLATQIASGSQTGLLSSTDWTTFTGKQAALSGTGFVKSTTGTISYDTTTYQPFITAGTTLQYWRGDKTWQTLNTSAVPEDNGNMYFSPARVLSTTLTGFTTGTNTSITVDDTVLSAFKNIQTQLNNKQATGAYLTAESDTLQTVTTRGATTSTAVTFTNATNNTLGTVASGAMQITAGGLGVYGNTTIGGALNVVGNVSAASFDSTTVNVGTSTATAINIGTASATQTVNIGTGSGVTTINLGGSGDTVNIAGTLTYVNTTDLNVTDKLITLNKGGAAASGGSAGIAIEENGVITGSMTTDRTSWVFKAAAGLGTISLTAPSATSVSAILSAGAITGTHTYYFPDVTGTIITTGDTGTVSNTMLAGSIPNNKLAYSTISGVSLGSNLFSLSAGNYLTWSVGAAYNGSAVSTLAVDATSSNTISKVVARDSAGNFSAGTITATFSGNLTGNVTGNADTATKLYTSRNIYGNSFDGSAALTQIIASTYGGTGNGFTKFSGPTTAEKTFTLPDVSTTILTKNYTGALATGIVKNTTSTGELSIAVAADFPTLNQSTTGQAGYVANSLTIGNGLSGSSYNGSSAVTVAVSAANNTTAATYYPIFSTSQGTSVILGTNSGLTYVPSTGTLTAAILVKSGGTSSQFLKADGSVDSSVYLTSYTETDTLQSVTTRGNTTTTTITSTGFVKSGGTSSQFLKADGTVDSNTYALSSAIPTVNSGTLGVSIGSAAATNTTVSWGTATGFNANTASNYTYDLKVGPALTNLASTMTGVGSGFVKKTAADTYSIDTTTYLSSQSSDFGTVSIGTDSGYTWGTANSNTSQVADTVADTLTLVRGLTGSTAGIDLYTNTVAGTDAIKIAHADTSTLTGSQGSAGIASITVDEMGHVTAVTAATYLTAETDTLQSVTTRGATTTNAITAPTYNTSNGLVSSTTLTTTTTTANQILDSTPYSSVRAIKYLISISSGTSYHITELLIMHDNANTYMTEYGTIITGVALATFDVDINSTNLRLLVTPTNATTTIKAMKIAVNT